MSKSKKKDSFRGLLEEFRAQHSDSKELVIFAINNLLNRFFWQFEHDEVPTIKKQDALIIAFFLMQNVSDKRLDKIILKFRKSEV